MMILTRSLNIDLSMRTWHYFSHIKYCSFFFVYFVPLFVLFTKRGIWVPVKSVKWATAAMVQPLELKEAGITPASSNGTPSRVLVGYKGMKRVNPKTDHFEVHRFHHVELWCGDALNTSRRYVRRRRRRRGRS